MLDKLFAPIESLITEHGSSTILKERIDQLREQMEHLVQENERLQKQLTAVESERDKMASALQKKSVPDEFTKHRGMLFRRLPNGDIQDEVYSPDCKTPMTSLQRVLPYKCSKCKLAASFCGNELRQIIAEIA